MNSIARLPHLPRELLARALAAWLLLRLLIGFGTVYASATGPMGSPLRLNPGAVLVLIAAVTTVSFVHLRRSNQDLFLASLGFSRRHVVALVVPPILALELVLAVVTR